MVKRTSYAALRFAAALLVASCSKSPTAVTSPPSPPPVVVAAVEIQIVVPETIAPAETAQLRATAIKADGSTEDVTSQATWMVFAAPAQAASAAAILQIAPTGAATGRTPGEVFVTARLGPLSATRTVFVLPAGTYRLIGWVLDSSVALDGASVAVVAGSGTGMTAVTGASGEFRFYGVGGPVQILSTRAGYRDRTESVQVNGHGNLGIQMVPNTPGDDYSGTYTLTISTRTACPAGFPDAAKRRSFTARVEQDPKRQLFMTLGGADFVLHNDGYGNRIFGRVASNGTTKIYITQDYYRDRTSFDIAERFAEGTFLVSGTATGTATSGRISTALEGEILIGNTNPPFATFTSRCPADRLEMVRQ
jgi:hypothetical protein